MAMRRVDYLILILVGLGLSLLFALLQPVPGYMDAEYYYSGGTRLAGGFGFKEMIIWNYLDNPQGIPHPAFTYWMPLPALIAAAGMILGQQQDFFSARIFFILLAGIIPALTAFFCSVLCNRRDWALMAGALALFPGFYSIYLTNTETFALYMILGALFLMIAAKPQAIIRGFHEPWNFLFLGIIAGFMHLTRADGILWLGCAVIWGLFSAFDRQNRKWPVSALFFGFLTVAGYILIMGLWYQRNLEQFGTLLSPGGSHTLFLNNYNQLFSYPVDQLNLQNWLAMGWGHHAQAWLGALVLNLQTAFAIGMEIVLLPFVLIGGWLLRRDRMVQLGTAMWLLTLIVMTIVFPYSGGRGGFFHSASALQILIWSCFPAGLDAAIRLGAHYRHWNSRQAWWVFSGGVIIICIVMTGVLFWARVLKPVNGSTIWGQSWTAAQRIDESLKDIGVTSDTPIMINNPPGMYAATKRPGIVIPDGDVNVLLDAAKKYKIKYLVLEENHPNGLADLFKNPRSIGDLIYLKTINTAQIYQIHLTE